MDSFGKIKRITELYVAKTNAEIIRADVEKKSAQRRGELYARLVAFKTIKNAITEIETGSITTTDENIEQLW